MKLKCTYNKDNDGVFTVGNIYAGEFCERFDNKNWYEVCNNLQNTSVVCLDGHFWKFEVVTETNEQLLTGLEAIVLLQQGKMVIEANSSDPFVYKIIDDNVCFKYPKEDDDMYEIDDAFNFSTIYKEYIEPKKLLTGWERVNEGEEYISISSRQLLYFRELCDSQNKEQFDTANYFSTEEKAEEINFKQTLFRKLQRFSDENGGNKIDWNDIDQTKYSIFYNGHSNCLSPHSSWTVHEFGQVYFISEEIAEQAIELFHDDLIKYFTQM